ncbi:MAG: hypothetical protein AAF686_01335 [Pseudomonadota bacterium]
MRLFIGAMALVGLAACTAQVPDSGAGIPNLTAQEYAQQRAIRDATLTGSALPPAGVISDEVAGLERSAAAPSLSQPQATRVNSIQAQTAGAPLNATGTQTVTAPAGAFARVGTGAAPTPGDALAQEAVAALAATAQGSNQVSQPTDAPVTTVANSSGISNENSFDAVGEARSIDADAQLIAQNRAQYQVVQPTALPQRSETTAPNVVQFALSTSHPVGTTLYSRSGINKQARAQRACAKYSSPDLAQKDFLAQGGPRRDRLGLDPDGDGFACGWDPRPFRAAIGG